METSSFHESQDINPTPLQKPLENKEKHVILQTNKFKLRRQTGFLLKVSSFKEKPRISSLEELELAVFMSIKTLLLLHCKNFLKLGRKTDILLKISSFKENPIISSLVELKLGVFMRIKTLMLFLCKNCLKLRRNLFFCWKLAVLKGIQGFPYQKSWNQQYS